MSWDADLWLMVQHDPMECIGSWNYTHNCNPMIEDALDPLGADTEAPWWVSVSVGETPPQLGRWSWWKLLDGMSGAAGAELTGHVISVMEDDPPRFRAMNPPNGWGDYDGLLVVLREMHKASLCEYVTVWSASG